MFCSARRIEHDTPLPEATGFGTSATQEVMADFEDRADMKLLRLGLETAMFIFMLCEPVNDGLETRAAAIVPCGFESVELMGVEVIVEVEIKSCAGEPGWMSSYAGGDCVGVVEAALVAPAPAGPAPIADWQVRSDWQDWAIARPVLAVAVEVAVEVAVTALIPSALSRVVRSAANAGSALIRPEVAQEFEQAGSIASEGPARDSELKSLSLRRAAARGLKLLLLFVLILLPLGQTWTASLKELLGAGCSDGARRGAGGGGGVSGRFPGRNSRGT